MREQDNSRGDRALELSERGIDVRTIAERLGVRSRQHIYAMIEKARERRAKKVGEVVGS